jgi:hypothetical protein
LLDRDDVLEWLDRGAVKCPELVTRLVLGEATRADFDALARDDAEEAERLAGAMETFEFDDEGESEDHSFDRAAAYRTLLEALGVARERDVAMNAAGVVAVRVHIGQGVKAGELLLFQGRSMVAELTAIVRSSACGMPHAAVVR